MFPGLRRQAPGQRPVPQIQACPHLIDYDYETLAWDWGPHYLCIGSGFRAMGEALKAAPHLASLLQSVPPTPTLSSSLPLGAGIFVCLSH